MLMKWVGCLNYNLQHDPSEKPEPSELPTTATVTVRPRYQVVVASL